MPLAFSVVSKIIQEIDIFLGDQNTEAQQKKIDSILSKLDLNTVHKDLGEEFSLFSYAFHVSDVKNSFSLYVSLYIMQYLLESDIKPGKWEYLEPNAPLVFGMLNLCNQKEYCIRKDMPIGLLKLFLSTIDINEKYFYENCNEGAEVNILQYFALSPCSRGHYFILISKFLIEELKMDPLETITWNGNKMNFFGIVQSENPLLLEMLDMNIPQNNNIGLELNYVSTAMSKIAKEAENLSKQPHNLSNEKLDNITKKVQQLLDNLKQMKLT